MCSSIRGSLLAPLEQATYIPPPWVPKRERQPAKEFPLNARRSLSRKLFCYLGKKGRRRFSSKVFPLSLLPALLSFPLLTHTHTRCNSAASGAMQNRALKKSTQKNTHARSLYSLSSHSEPMNFFPNSPLSLK
jgi:hypothetical protein